MWGEKEVYLSLSSTLRFFMLSMDNAEDTRSELERACRARQLLTARELQRTDTHSVREEPPESVPGDGDRAVKLVRGQGEEVGVHEAELCEGARVAPAKERQEDVGRHLGFDARL